MSERFYSYGVAGFQQGRLTFTGRMETRPKAKKYFEASCECGSKQWIYVGSLNRGAISCGCAKGPGPQTEEVVKGAKYERLTLSGRSEVRRGKLHAEAVCACGGLSWPVFVMVKQGRTKSCGCLKRETSTLHRKTHGQEPARLWRIYNAMKTRCGNPNAKSYANYGAQGVRICGEWDSFEAFRDWALANGYADDLTIDRIESKGGYSPDNCRWVPKSEQSANRRPSSEWKTAPLA